MGVTVIEEDYAKLLLDEYVYDIKCSTTNMIVKKNGALVMGGGTAKIMLDRFPGIDKQFGTIIRQNKNRQMIQVVHGHLHWDDYSYLVGFPTKIDFKDDSPLWLVERSMKQLIAFKYMVGANKVLLPAPGCALGGLDWESQVRPLIESVDGVDESIHICIKR
jgi:hypothetical protein